MIDTRTISEKIDDLVGDTSVAEQLSMALEHVALKDHTHDNYATRNEVEDFKRKIDMLMELVGDTSVSEQICAAIENIN